MGYDSMIDYDNVILADCERFYKNGKRIIINDGRIVDIGEEEN